MKYKIILIILVYLFSSQQVLAQIEGQVIDEKENPVEFANVCLLSEDSVLISGTTTNAQGFFRITNVEAGYFLHISCIGYTTIHEKLDAERKTYLLSPLSVDLEEVTVIARKNAITVRGTDLIADVEHSVLRDFGTANDILDKIPMVYGRDGNFSVFGKESTVIYINRRKVTDLSELARISSNDISSIEVIRNPGIAYDANTDAVIKINLKRNIMEDWGIWAMLKDEQGRKNSDNEQVRITYGSGIINGFVSFGNSSARLSTDQQNMENTAAENHLWTLSSEMDEWESYYYNQNLTGGLSIFLNDNHTVGGQVSYSKETDHWGGVSSSLMKADCSVFEELSSDIVSRSNYKQWNSNLYYEGRISDKVTIGFNGDILRRNAKYSRVNQEGGSLTEAHEVTTSNDNEYNIYAGLATLHYDPNQSTSFTFGANVSFVENDMYSQTMEDEAEYNLSGLHSEETKYALFAEGTRNWKMFSASLGLRYEMFKMTYTDKHAQSVLEDRTYSRLYPYISCSYSGRDIKMGLSLSTKVKHPNYYQLRNSTEYLNRYAMEMGNPMLLPQYTTGLSYTAKYRKLTFSMDYQWINNYIISSNLVIQSDPLVSVSKPVNLSHYTALNASLSYNTKIGVWEPYLSANLMRTFLNIYNEDGTRANGKRPYMVVSFNNYWELKNNWMPYLLLEYDGDGYMREYQIKQRVIVGIGIVKRLFNNALYIRLSADNLLGAKENEIRYDTNYAFSKKRYRDNRKVGLYIRYMFNNKKKYKGKSSVGDEINRM